MFEYPFAYITEIGSRMWGMATPTSDSDREYVYIVPTRDILSGRYPGHRVVAKKFVEDGVQVDAQFKEIGHIITQLIKGNINAVWSVTTPNVIAGTAGFRQLRRVTLANLSKHIYPSIHGYATAMIRDADRVTEPVALRKRRRAAYRIANQGVELFSVGKIRYQPAPDEVTPAMLNEILIALADAYATTDLPDTGDADAFHEFLYDVRMVELW